LKSAVANNVTNKWQTRSFALLANNNAWYPKLVQEVHATDVPRSLALLANKSAWHHKFLQMGHASNAPRSLVRLFGKSVCTRNLVNMQHANVVEPSPAHVATLKECLVNSMLEVLTKDVCIVKPPAYPALRAIN
jgi:hypothetical protein